MTSTRLSAIRAARLAASAPPAAIRCSTMSTIAQCRHSSASSSVGAEFHEKSLRNVTFAMRRKGLITFDEAGKGRGKHRCEA